jgi:hypothetical protein
MYGQRDNSESATQTAEGKSHGIAHYDSTSKHNTSLLRNEYSAVKFNQRAHDKQEQ